MSKYDLPAAFNYISKLTNQSLIDYFGHSMGSEIMFMALALKEPFVLQHIKHIVFIGPDLYQRHPSKEEEVL